MVVDRALTAQGISRYDLGREKFVEKVWEWKEKYGNEIIDQLTSGTGDKVHPHGTGMAGAIASHRRLLGAHLRQVRPPGDQHRSGETQVEDPVGPRRACPRCTRPGGDRSGWRCDPRRAPRSL